MNEFLQEIIAFPTGVYTGLLGLVLFYWLFVIFGALDIDIIGGGGDVDGLVEGAGGKVDGLLEGAGGKVDGLLEGAGGKVDGLIEGAGGKVDGLIEGAGGKIDGLAEGAAGKIDGLAEGAAGKVDGIAEGAGDAADLLALIGLRKAPFTVVFSLLVMWSWVIVGLTMRLVDGFVAEGLIKTLVGIGVMVGGFFVSMPFAGLCARPMGPLFETARATTRAALIGNICTVDTGKVTATFGQAQTSEKQQWMLFQVRCDKTNSLTRGDEALIVDFDKKREAYIIEPLADDDQRLLSDGISEG